MDNIREKNNKERTNKREFVKKSPYEEKVISIGRVSKTTKGGRTMRFTATVAVGDRKGKVGLGTGKANEVPNAISKAIKAAEKNVITVNLVEGRTLSHEVIGKCGAAKVLVKPAKAGSGIIAGGPVRNVLELAGVKDIVSKSLGSNTQINTAKAAAKGTLPTVAKPAAVVTKSCSAIPTLKNLSGNSFAKIFV